MAADLAWLVVLVVLPGACVTVALCARGASLSVPTVCALVLAAGYGVCGTIALVLAVAGQLSGAPMLAGTLLVSAAALGLALRWRPLETWRAPVWAALRSDRWPLALGLVAAGLIGGSAVRYDPAVNLANAGRWRYWADGREIALLGHVPSVSSQWGAQYPTTVSKLLLNCFSGAFSTLAGGQVLPAYGALYVLGALGTALALWALAWELGLRFSAPLLPVLSEVPLHLHGVRIPIGERFIYFLGLYRAEMIGRLAAFTALALVVRSLRNGGRALPITAGLLLGAAAISHGVAALAVVLLGASLAAAWLAVHRRIGPLLRTSALVAVPAVLFAAIALLAAGGTLGFGGATSRYLPVQGRDPTALFRGGHRPLRTSTLYEQPRPLAETLASAALGGHRASQALLVLLLVGGLAFVAVSLWLLSRDAAVIPLASAAFTALLFLVALAFSARSHAYIPATFAQRRLYDYAGPAVVLALLPWVEWVLRRLSRLGLVAAVGGALVAAALAAVVAWDLRPPWVSPQGPKLAAAMMAIHDHVPCGARVLPNRRSNAAFEVLAGRESVLEGMAPYLRPDVLVKVLHQISAAEQALSATPASLDFLHREHIGYVVLIAGGAGVAHSADPQALAKASWLQRVYADRNVTIYKVAGSRPGAPPPGFDCNAIPTGA